MCHLVLLMPVFGLALFWLLPFGYALPINVFLWATSAFLYYQTARAMRQPRQDGFESLIGTHAEVVSTQSPAYYAAPYLVKTGGELWTARSPDVLQPGEMVSVAATDGISLVVERTNHGFHGGQPRSIGTRQTGVKTDERHCH